jgi:hypothetical protein
MKNALFAGMITLALSLTSTAAVAADDYAIINETGMEITALHMSPNNQDDWGDDILGQDLLEDGDECGIEFHPDDEECAYDIKIVDGDGKGWVVMNIDLCKYTKVTFKTQGGKVVYSAS